MDIAILTFKHGTGAERAYARAREELGEAPWMRELAFVECHRKGRIVVRGTFAGRYLDVDDLGDAMGKQTAEGAIAGAIAGAAFGPPGFAAGLVGGGMIGGRMRAGHVDPPHGMLYDEIHATVPEGCSALVAYAPPADVDAMLAALADRAERVERHLTTDDEARGLTATVDDAPPAAAG